MSVSDLFDDAREWELVAALIASPAVIPAVVREFESGDFGSEDARKVYVAAISIYARGGEPDLFLIRDELRNDTKLMRRLLDVSRDRTIVGQNAVFHARRLRGLAMLRRLRSMAADLTDIDPTDEPAEVIAKATEMLRAAGADVPTLDMHPAEMALEAESEIEEHVRSDSVLATGIPTLDRMLDGGLAPSRLYVLGARPSVGKSALATNMVRLALDEAKRVLFCSLEMTGSEVLRRLAGEKYGIESRDTTRLVEAWNGDEIQGWPLHYMGLANLTTLTAKARELKPQGLALLVIDYLQLLPSSERFERRDLEIGHMTRTLKLLAVELKIPVLALSQLNRQADDRSQPRLAHLRESGNIEQDANVVMLLHRDPDDAERSREAVLAVAKNRHGPSGPVSLVFRPNLTQFRERALMGVVS